MRKMRTLFSEITEKKTKQRINFVNFHRTNAVWTDLLLIKIHSSDICDMIQSPTQRFGAYNQNIFTSMSYECINMTFSSGKFMKYYDGTTICFPFCIGNFNEFHKSARCVPEGMCVLPI